MKIAFLIKELIPNAGQTQDIAEIVNYLLSSTPIWQISVMANKIDYPLLPGLNDKRVRVIKLKHYFKYMLFRGGLTTVLKDYDVIYIKGNYPYFFPALKSKKPTILVVHQLDSAKLFKSFFTKIKIIATKTLTGYMIRKPSVVVTISEELANFYFKKYGIKVHVIEDQISDTYFLSGNRIVPDQSSSLKLLTVGYWDGKNGRKRQDILLRYFADCVKVKPNLTLSMVGLSNDNLKLLGEISGELKLTKHVTLEGYLESDKLAQKYFNSHLFVTATSFEGFYRQVIEGFASGLPALVYDSRIITKEISSSASVNHVIKSGAGELYYDSESFVTSLNKIIGNYEKYSVCARSYAKLFSKEIVGIKTKELLTALTSDIKS